MNALPFQSRALAKVRDTLERGEQRLANEIIRRPLRAVLIGFGAGFVVARFPVLRLLFGVTRAAVPMAPTALAAFGALRAWELASRGMGTRLDANEPESLNDLLANELSAVASYDRLIDRFDGEDRRVLEHLKAVHHEGARRLKECVREHGGRPFAAAAPWEGLTGVLHQPASRLSDAEIGSLILSSEESSVRAFDAALEDPAIPEPDKGVIRQHLLPRAHENVTTILRHRSRR